MSYKKMLTVAILGFSLFSVVSPALGAEGEQSTRKTKACLIHFAEKLYEEVQLEGNAAIWEFIAENQLTEKEGLAVLRLAAQIAEKSHDKITRKLIEVEHEKLLNIERWYCKGAGFVGRSLSKVVALGASPFKKGFDGACYAVGGAAGLAAAGATLTAAPFVIAWMLYKKYGN